jgi:hypothetical protein
MTGFSLGGGFPLASGTMTVGLDVSGGQSGVTPIDGTITDPGSGGGGYGYAPGGLGAGPFGGGGGRPSQGRGGGGTPG